MSAQPEPGLLAAAMRAAEESLIKIEMAGGITTWEAMPGPKHQRLVKAIDASVQRRQGSENNCGCYSFMDVTLRFPDGSFKRPDVAIYWREPEDDNNAIDFLPEVVIEVVSQGYEAKDLQIGLPFYLGQGIKDVVVYDPSTLVVLHARRDGTKRLVAPVDLQFECGCTCTIPL
jgi:Uma2 family endonuclease